MEDGGPLSFFGIFLSGLMVLGGFTVLCVDLFMNLFGSVLSVSGLPYVSAYLFPAYFVFPLVAVLIYVILETILVAKYLGEQKPLGRFDGCLSVCVCVCVCVCVFVTAIDPLIQSTCMSLSPSSC